MQGEIIFIHQHVAQHWKWQTKQSRQLVSRIDLTDRFEISGIITIPIIPFLIILDNQTISILVWLARFPICVTKRNAAALPNPLSFLENKVIQMKTTQCGNFRIFLSLRFCVKSIFCKSKVWKMTVLTCREALNFYYWKISALNDCQIFPKWKNHSLERSQNCNSLGFKIIKMWEVEEF